MVRPKKEACFRIAAVCFMFSICIMLYTTVFPALFPEALSEHLSEPQIHATRAFETTDKQTIMEDHIKAIQAKIEPIAPIYDLPLSPDLQRYTWRLCRERGLDYEVVLAVMHLESGFDPTCISQTSDYGLMQINTINHENLRTTLGITDFLDPYQSINAGTYILAAYGGSGIEPHTLLMAYNLGPTGAARRIADGHTQTNYSKTVLQYASSLKEEQP